MWDALARGCGLRVLCIELSLSFRLSPFDLGCLHALNAHDQVSDRLAEFLAIPRQRTQCNGSQFAGIAGFASNPFAAVQHGLHAGLSFLDIGRLGSNSLDCGKENVELIGFHDCLFRWAW